MGGWFDVLFAACSADHDKRCIDGAACGIRGEHIRRNYVPEALRKEVDRLRRIIDDARMTLADEPIAESGDSR